MANSILSVRTDNLLEKVWTLLTDRSAYFEKKGKNIDEIIFIYNELCRCSKEINDCEDEDSYVRIEDKVNMCESQINSYN